MLTMKKKISKLTEAAFWGSIALTSQSVKTRAKVTGPWASLKMPYYGQHERPLLSLVTEAVTLLGGPEGLRYFIKGQWFPPAFIILLVLRFVCMCVHVCLSQSWFSIPVALNLKQFEIQVEVLCNSKLLPWLLCSGFLRCGWKHILFVSLLFGIPPRGLYFEGGWGWGGV